MRNKTFGLTLIAAAMILSGCTTLAPEYERPAAPIAQAWPQDLATKNVRVLTNGLAQWGEFFQDERLRSLIQQGLENNRDLRVSALNVEKARVNFGCLQISFTRLTNLILHSPFLPMFANKTPNFV